MLIALLTTSVLSASTNLSPVQIAGMVCFTVDDTKVIIKAYELEPLYQARISNDILIISNKDYQIERYKKIVKNKDAKAIKYGLIGATIGAVITIIVNIFT